ncbi:MAG: hypothetical protein R3345_00210 [Fulvivirga sp.]|nr:hypothetical protein [Fulvivirga sp.]
MKSKFVIIIIASAVAISFAFITVNKQEMTKKSNEQAEIKKQPHKHIKGFAIEDANQWD